MRKYATVLILAAALSAVASPVKVMTYNVRYSAGDATSADNNWEARRDDLANLVGSANPDVAGFQEVLPGQRKWLEARFPGYAFVGDGRNADRVSGEAPPEGSWRTFNYWTYKEKEQTIAEALAKPVRERSTPGDKSDSKRIDYIYVSPGTRVLGYRTIATTRPGTKLYPSDHFPSVAEVVIGATTASK